MSAGSEPHVPSVGVVTKRKPAQCLAMLLQLRDVRQQREYIANTGISPDQPLLEAISSKIRELLPRDPELAEILAETSWYIASLIETPVAWGFANRSRAQVLWTMR